MREAMASAEVGDDVFGDDPTVRDLESHVAQLLGKEASVFVSSGTQSNLCALMAHCQRGDEYLVGDHAHTYMYEAGGAAVLGSIQPQTIPMLDSGMLDLNAARSAIKPDDPHFAQTRLLCLENTTDGKVIEVEDLYEGRELVDEHNLGYHLDGARLWNAAVALEVEPSDIAAPFDTVSVCLSKRERLSDQCWRARRYSSTGPQVEKDAWWSHAPSGFDRCCGTTRDRQSH